MNSKELYLQILYTFFLLLYKCVCLQRL